MLFTQIIQDIKASLSLNSLKIFFDLVLQKLFR